MVWANANLSIPEHWRPQLIIDLSYSEASLAKEYSAANGVAYIDGLTMFKAQAEAQRAFLSKLIPGFNAYLE